MDIQYPFFVQAARVSAHFHFASKKAKTLLLIAHNARAISVRAGQQAVGFKAITDFIDELAKKTMEHANQINKIAVTTSRMAATQSVHNSCFKTFNKVMEQCSDAQFVQSIQPCRDNVLKEINTNQNEFNRNLQQLNNLLEEAQRQMMSAIIISSTSKVEATLAGQYRQQLESIAQSIETSAHEINHELTNAERLMKRAKAEPH